MEPMLGAATALFESLDSEQRQRACFHLDPEPLGDWFYMPRESPGLAVMHMREPQRTLLWGLVESALSNDGAGKARGVYALERILGEIEGRPDYRDPERYGIWLFGVPSATALWGWRFEGHHLSLTFLIDPKMGVITTPIFVGANRQIVPKEHNHAGLRVLPAEEDLAFELINELPADVRQAVIIGGDSPGDIITGPGRENSLRTQQGIAFKFLRGEDLNRAMGLLELYLGNLRRDLMETETARIQEAGLDEVHLAWAGSLQPGSPHYYRLHGPTFVMEYENSQNSANHCHSVWHNPATQMGRDLLKAHFEDDHGAS